MGEPERHYIAASIAHKSEGAGPIMIFRAEVPEDQSAELRRVSMSSSAASTSARLSTT